MILKRKTLNGFFIFILMSVFFVSCLNKKTQSQFHSIEDAKWNREDTCKFEFQITDTINPYDVFIEIRNTKTYPYSNFWLFVDFKTPEGKIRRDTIECQLADEYGNWYGKGFGLHLLSIPYEQSLIFPHSGTYSFYVQHGMREFEIPGINDVGIKLTREK